MIKTIIFDAGGVLIKNNWGEISKKIGKKHGKPVLIYSSKNEKAIEEYHHSIIGKGSLEKSFEMMGVDKEIMPELIKDYKKIYNKKKKINKKLFKLIKKLKKDYEVICLTDTNKVHFDANLEVDLFKVFNKVFASHLQKARKTSLSAFKKVLKELKRKPEETLFIDDNKENINNAKRLKMKAILYKDFPKITKLKKQIYGKIK